MIDRERRNATPRWGPSLVAPLYAEEGVGSSPRRLAACGATTHCRHLEGGHPANPDFNAPLTSRRTADSKGLDCMQCARRAPARLALRHLGAEPLIQPEAAPVEVAGLVRRTCRRGTARSAPGCRACPCSRPAARPASAPRAPPPEQVDMQLLALAQPVAALAHQLGLGLDDAERHALGVGAEARHGLPSVRAVRDRSPAARPPRRPRASAPAPG